VKSQPSPSRSASCLVNSTRSDHSAPSHSIPGSAPFIQEGQNQVSSTLPKPLARSQASWERMSSRRNGPASHHQRVYGLEPPRKYGEGEGASRSSGVKPTTARLDTAGHGGHGRMSVILGLLPVGRTAGAGSQLCGHTLFGGPYLRYSSILEHVSELAYSASKRRPCVAPGASPRETRVPRCGGAVSGIDSIYRHVFLKLAPQAISCRPFGAWDQFRDTL
jgi:hypothetical protein